MKDAPPDGTFSPDAAAIRFDDSMRNREAYAHALRLIVKNGLKILATFPARMP
ncbi:MULTISPECIES: hypothetical protein [Bradyrhizobium]|uniref:hypothetical protein n=1 Tax=Bradyrhizobium TaxID=374 RepID=UPI0023023A50|nr:hypothetical protein [Bradyrhizobium sp. CCBAU 11357]